LNVNWTAKSNKSKNAKRIPAFQNRHIRRRYPLLYSVMTGKTTLSQTFTLQPANESYQSTIGVDYMSRVLERDYNYSVNIWDFSGEFQTYTEIRNEFYKELTAIVYVFDLGLKRTLDNLEMYIKEAAENGV